MYRCWILVSKLGGRLLLVRSHDWSSECQAAGCEEEILIWAEGHQDQSGDFDPRRPERRKNEGMKHRQPHNREDGVPGMTRMC